MATRPTRQQEQAGDRLAKVLLDLAEATRLDGRGTLGLDPFREVARLVAKGSSAFDLDAIILRALENRGRYLGLRSGTVELLTLVEGVGEPLATLLLTDEEFRALVQSAEEKLGDV